MDHNQIQNNELLEQILFEFEQSWINDQASRVEDFIPSAGSSNYLEILTELVRSEMEFRCEAEEVFTSEEYFNRFPVLIQSQIAREAIVFEEFRLRRARGDSVNAESLGRRYGIDSAQWPSFGIELSGVRRATSTTPDSASRRKPKFPLVGETVGDFELVGLLGEGAFGRVYLAQQGKLESRLVVLKFTSQKTDEHRLLAKLQHTNIVPIHSVHRIGDLQAICMPLLGIATLDDVLRFFGKSGTNRVSQHSNALVQTVNRQRERTVAETFADDDTAKSFQTRQHLSAEMVADRRSDSSLQEFAARFVYKMAEGLGYAHQRGIVHGDLKPANLLVNDDGDPVILDFHLSHSQDDEIGQLIGGTLPYMSPEHLQAMSKHDSELKPTMDVYASGVILYELLTGSLPFEEELKSTFSPDELATAKRRSFLVSDLDRKSIGKDLSAIVETCLDANPDNRFQSGSELAAELQRALEFRLLQKASNSGLKNRVYKWAKRNPRLSSGSTILAVCSLFIAGSAIAFGIVNSRLNDIKAIETSRNHIELARSHAPSLATSFGLHDRSFFDKAIIDANELLQQNSWANTNNLNSQRYFRRLKSGDAQSESLTAAELHFWMAEAH